MLVLFVGWGTFFVYMLWRFRASRNPKADYVGVRSHASTWLEVGVAVVEVVLLVGFSIPLWAERVDELPPPRSTTVVRVVGEQFAWNVHYPGADGVFGRTDPKLIDPQTNPLGLDRDDPGGQGRHHDAQPAAPAGEQAGRDPPVEQGRDPQLQPAAHAGEAGRDPGPVDPGVVHADHDHRRDARRARRTPNSCTRSPAPSCAASATTMRGFLTVETAEEYAAWLAAQAPAEGQDTFWQ